jgi:6-pyruvoyltetrahydropterin/6-carboxytetrahydropterin synthase
VSDNTIAVRHNIEVAHRLWQLPGKCEAIHGHSMWVRLELAGVLDRHGLLSGLDFGAVKARFREYLDSSYDHHLLLDRADPVLTALAGTAVPRIHTCPAQPTTEHIAMWVGQWARGAFPGSKAGMVTVNETHVNEASWEW